MKLAFGTPAVMVGRVAAACCPSLLTLLLLTLLMLLLLTLLLLTLLLLTLLLLTLLLLTLLLLTLLLLMLLTLMLLQHFLHLLMMLLHLLLHLLLVLLLHPLHLLHLFLHLLLLLLLLLLQMLGHVGLEVFIEALSKQLPCASEGAGHLGVGAVGFDMRRDSVSRELAATLAWAFHQLSRAGVLVGTPLMVREAASAAVPAHLYVPGACGGAVRLELPPHDLLMAPGVWALNQAVLARAFVLDKVAQVDNNLAPQLLKMALDPQGIVDVLEKPGRFFGAVQSDHNVAQRALASDADGFADAAFAKVVLARANFLWVTEHTYAKDAFHRLASWLDTTNKPSCIIFTVLHAMISES